MSGPKHMLTTTEVAKLAGVSPDTVRDWISSGRLTAYNFSRSKRPSYRIKPSDFTAFLEGMKVPQKTRRRRPRRKGTDEVLFSEK